MIYTVLIAPHVRRDMESLPKSVIARMDAKILSLAQNPRPHGSLKLQGAGKGYRLRVGDYRILYEIDDAAETVTVTTVAHRRESYR